MLHIPTMKIFIVKEIPVSNRDVRTNLKTLV